MGGCIHTILARNQITIVRPAFSRVRTFRTNRRETISRFFVGKLRTWLAQTKPFLLHPLKWEHRVAYNKYDESVTSTDWSAAYLNDGKYNVFMVDWGGLAAIPCYAAAVHNLKPVAKCTAVMLTHLRRAGLDVDQLTCVGHSLGAHVCGIMANYLPFRMYRIIGTYQTYT